MRCRRLIALLLAICIFVLPVSAANSNPATDGKTEQGFNIERVEIGESIDKCEIKLAVKKISENIFMTDPYNSSQIFFYNPFECAMYFRIVGNLPTDKTISKIWSASEYSDHPEIQSTADGKFVLEGKEFAGNYDVFDTTSSKPGSFRATGYFSGCYYFELNDGTVYTLIIDSDHNNHDKQASGASFVGLYDETSKIWLGEEAQVVPTNDRATHLKHISITSDKPMILSAQVKNFHDEYLTDAKHKKVVTTSHK